MQPGIKQVYQHIACIGHKNEPVAFNTVVNLHNNWHLVGDVCVCVCVCVGGGHWL